MWHNLSAIIWKESIIDIIHEEQKESIIIPLKNKLFMIPLNELFIKNFNENLASPIINEFTNLNEKLLKYLKTLSKIHGQTIWYIETDYCWWKWFQSAIWFKNWEIVLDKRKKDKWITGPINSLLRILWVIRWIFKDEFDTVWLSKFKYTDEIELDNLNGDDFDE